MVIIFFAYPVVSVQYNRVVKLLIKDWKKNNSNLLV